MNLILLSKLSRFNAVAAEQAAAETVVETAAEIETLNRRKSVIADDMSQSDEITTDVIKQKSSSPI
jgi:hypothetical protein